MMISYLKNLGILLVMLAAFFGLLQAAIYIDKLAGRYVGLSILIGILLLAGAGLLTYLDPKRRL